MELEELRVTSRTRFWSWVFQFGKRFATKNEGVRWYWYIRKRERMDKYRKRSPNYEVESTSFLSLAPLPSFTANLIVSSLAAHPPSYLVPCRQDIGKAIRTCHFIVAMYFQSYYPKPFPSSSQRISSVLSILSTTLTAVCKVRKREKRSKQPKVFPLSSFAETSLFFRCCLFLFSLFFSCNNILHLRGAICPFQDNKWENIIIARRNKYFITIEIIAIWFHIKKAISDNDTIFHNKSNIDRAGITSPTFALRDSVCFSTPDKS